MSRCLLLGFALSAVACGGAGVLPSISIAARRGDIAWMRQLLDAGADPNEPARDGNGWPPLMHAIHKGQFEAAALLLEHGADPNGAGPAGYTALMMAAADSDSRMVRLLLDHGADPHRRGPGGMTALSQAVTGGALGDIDRPLLGGCHADTVRALLEFEPDLTLPSSAAGAEARFWAHLHAGLQKMWNVATVRTTGARPVTDCGAVLNAARRRP